MKINFKSIFFVFVFCAFSLVTYAQNRLPSIERIIKRGTLIVAITVQDFPPFHWRDKNGHLTGYDIYTAEDMAKKLGVKVAYYAKSSDLNELADELNQQKADIIISYAYSLPRAEKIIYSLPHLNFIPALLVNNLFVAKNKTLTSAEKILTAKNITVGTLEGSNFIDILKNQYPQVTVITYADIDQACADVAQGKITAAFYANQLISRWLAAHPEANLYTQTMVIPNQYIPLGAAVSWQNPDLIHWVNTYFTLHQGDGTLTTLRNQFFGVMP